ncbi:MAG: nicotinate-nucleotide adenylyltransferase [Firmicutes bacterium]|nr:nicotinate-nucleotide adenylyltransferase [Bacillota bacterium]
MKIGIFGGSFDPVHLGHEALAEDACRQCGLTEVIMVPARIQPFKQDKKTASGEDRFRMLALVAEQDDHITVSRYELDNEGVSYTYLTLRAMQERHPGAELYFICGADSFLKIDTWMNAEELLRNYSYIIGARPGYREDEVREQLDRLRKEYGTEVIVINNKQLDISSTEIRERLNAGERVDDLVPEPVERYIKEHELYG